MSQLNPRYCMTPNCDGDHYTRGLCKRCYQVAYHMVKKKLTTWLRLETKGLCLPRRRVPQNHFEVAFNKAEKEGAA